MNNLISEQRVDRNGKLVTRHVKTKVEAASRGAIAPPKLGKQDSLRQLKLELAEALQMPEEQFKRMAEPWRLEGMLSLVRSHDVSWAAGLLIDGMVSIHKDNEFNSCLGLLSRNYTLADQTLAQHPSKAADYRTYAPELVTALNLYDFEMTPEDEAVLIGASCKLWVNDALDDGSFFEELFPSDPLPNSKRDVSIGNIALRDDLARYVIAHPDKTELIVSMVTERKISDPIVINDLLEGTGTATLSSGVL
jgi:hypothetical protein